MYSQHIWKFYFGNLKSFLRDLYLGAWVRHDRSITWSPRHMHKRCNWYYISDNSIWYNFNFILPMYFWLVITSFPKLVRSGFWCVIWDHTKTICSVYFHVKAKHVKWCEYVILDCSWMYLIFSCPVVGLTSF